MYTILLLVVNIFFSYLVMSSAAPNNDQLHEPKSCIYKLISYFAALDCDPHCKQRTCACQCQKEDEKYDLGSVGCKDGCSECVCCTRKMPQVDKPSACNDCLVMFEGILCCNVALLCYQGRVYTNPNLSSSEQHDSCSCGCLCNLCVAFENSRHHCCNCLSAKEVTDKLVNPFSTFKLGSPSIME